MADGPTPEAAVAEARVALGLALDVLRDYGDDVPAPDAGALAHA
jgi:predicted RNase H-like HicB family nuclease